MQDRHAQFEGDTLRFRFTGKAGKEHVVELSDRRGERAGTMHA